LDRIDALKNRISETPGDPILHYELGKLLYQKNDFDGAVQVLKRSIELAPEKINVHLLLAKAYAKNHNYFNAKAQYQKILSLDPSNQMAHMNLGFVYELYLKDAPRALAHYQKYVELGGKDPRIIRRVEERAEDLKKGRIFSKPSSRQEERKQSGIAAVAQEKAASETLREVYRLRDRATAAISENRDSLKRGLSALAVFVILLQCLRAFPVAPPYIHLFAALALAGLTALHASFGLAAGLTVMFFPIAFHSPLLGYLYAGGAFLLFVSYGAQYPGKALAVLLMPQLLKLNLAYSVPLGAAILMGAGAGAGLGAVASIAGLGYMVAGNIHQLGPLALNLAGAPTMASLPPVADPDFFLKFQWIKSMASPEVSRAFQTFFHALYPALLHPPIVFLQIGAWGIAGYAAGKLYQKRSPLFLASALGAAASVFLLQAVIVESLPGDHIFSSWMLLKSLVFSVVLVALLVFFKVTVQEKEFSEELGDIRWDSIGGLEDVKREIQAVTQHQFERRSSRLAKKYDLKATKGILFYGPPGCGKTMFAKVLAKEVGASFYSVKGSDFRSMWYGETEKNLTKIFEQARQNSPSVIFFDEIDNMLGKRGETMTSDSPEKRIVAIFLSEMDGVKSIRNVLVVGATNEPDLIDPAALRPGRFDKLIYIPLPDAKGREKIFRVHLKKKPLAEGIDFPKLARLTERFSGADIADVCSKVAEQAMQESLRTGKKIDIDMTALQRQIKSSKPSVSLKLLRKYEELQEKYSRRTIKSETGAAEEKQRYSWNQVGGLEQVKKELIEAVETPLTKPQLYEKYKIKPPKGILLYGPPGCGKTLMAKVVAGQCGAHFLSVDLKKETTDGIKEWFIRARENKPSVLFFDEIDSIAASRDFGMMAGHGLVTQLLVELDGMEDLKQVVIIAATNKPDHLDSALMRPGRFDRLIYIPPPDESSRLEILRIHLQDKPLTDDVDLGTIARQTDNYSGADLGALCYEASMCLIRKADAPHPRITGEDITLAMEKIKSSIAPEDLSYFEEMKTKYSRG